LKAALARPSSACCFCFSFSFVAVRVVFMCAGYSIADGFASNRITRYRNIPNSTLDHEAPSRAALSATSAGFSFTRGTYQSKRFASSNPAAFVVAIWAIAANCDAASFPVKTAALPSRDVDQ
jgi:hypothetical protein